MARPGIPKDLFAGSLPGELVTALRQHNEARPAQEQIRLRMVLHAGEVTFDDHGATSAAVNLAFRLLDAAPLKAALAGSPGVLAVIASSWFFGEVISPSRSGGAATWRRVRVSVKETCVPAWISLPDNPYPPDEAAQRIPQNKRVLPAPRRILPLNTLPVVELQDEVRLINSQGSYSLIGEPVARIRTFTHSRRHREVILVVRENGISLLGIYLKQDTEPKY